MIAAAAAAWLATVAPAFGEAGLTGAATLRRPTAARPVALGDAFCAVDGGLDSLGYNPAGAAASKRPQLGTLFAQGSNQDHFGFAGYEQPLPFGSVSGGLAYYDAGAVHLQLSDGTDSVVDAEQDYVGAVSAAVRAPGGLALGATGRAYRLRLAQQATASGFAADVGALWHSPIRGLNLGASLSNAGPDVKFEQQGDPLPLTARVGAAYSLDLEPAGANRGEPYGVSGFLVTADASQTRYERLAEGAGFELAMRLTETGLAALRAGYVVNPDAGGLTAGVGLREGRYVFDYAFAARRALNDVHTFAFGILF